MSALKKNAKRLGTLFLAATVIGGSTDWTSVKAESQYSQIDNMIMETSSDIAVQSKGTFNDEDLPSNDELFYGYLEQLFYGTSTSTYSLGFGESAFSQLNENEKKIYSKLKEFITEVANGKQERAELYLYPNDITINGIQHQKNIDLPDINFSKEFSWEEGENEKDAYTKAGKELQTEIEQKIDCKNIIRTLLIDCPYELYWFAKTVGYIAGPSISYSYFSSLRTGTATVPYIQFSFTVDKNYAQSDDKYLVDNTKVERAQKAKANADAIIENNKDLDDYNKLKAYLTAICDLNEYNNDALHSSPEAMGIDPWQLVYVFDGDTSTNVVCEGYSKAFAYLCERSTFQNDIKCYIVTGTLTGGTGAGGHMWNIVTMEDGKNYMVDVTNCDGSSIGNPDQLFLAGLPGSVAEGYQFTRDASNKASFIYDNETKNLYPESILTLASDNYKYTSKLAAAISNKDYSTSYTYGETITEPAKENFTTTNTDSDAVWDFQWYEGDQTEGNLSSLEALSGTPKNAGTYTLVAKITSTNFAPTETRIPVTINAKNITLNAQNTDRHYGESNPKFTYQLAEGQTLADGDNLSDLKVTLTTTANENSKPGTYDIIGTAANANYNITFNKGTLTVNKKESISLEEQRNYSYATGSNDSLVTIEVASKLPTDIGEVTYKAAADDSSSDIISNVTISADGKLTYKVPASTDSTVVGKKAVITVTISSTHYEDLVYKVTVTLTDNIQITSKNPVTLVKNTLVYGDKLSSLSFADVEFMEEETGNKVEGTLAFKEPDTVPEVGTTSADWIFTPTSNAYDTVSGSVRIIVNRRPITISNDKYVDNYIYTGEPISAPKEEDFIIHEDLSSPAFRFDWYDLDKNLLKEIPSSIGEYVLQVTIAESKNYSEGVLKIPVSIKNYTCADATLDSELKGSNNWYHGTINIVPPAGHLISTDKKTWESKLVISEDRTGNFSYYLKEEKTAYVSDEKQIVVNLDTIAPTGSISAGDKVWNTFLSSISFGFYTNTEESFTIKAEDDASGMEKGKIEYLITDKSYAGEDGLRQLSQLPESDWTLYSAGAKIKQNTVNIIYAKLTDQAGNITYLSTDKILQDSIKPEIVLSAEGTKYTDSIGSNAYDGSVVYTARVQGEDAPLKSLHYSLDGAAAIDLKDGEKITINTPGIHVLKIIAEDNAGNQSTVTETVHVYTDFSFRLDGASSVYDGQPIELEADFKAITSIPTGEISFSYSAADSEDKRNGLPTDAGNYLIYAEIAEDTEKCYKPQSATMKYTIEPKEIAALDQTLFITKNLAVDYTFDVSKMITEVTGDTIYTIVSVSGSGILADTPKLEGSMLTIPIEAVNSEEQTATIEISFSNPNYIIKNAVLTLAPTDKTVVQLTGVTMPETGIYNGEKFAYSGTPVWTTENGEKVEVSDIIVLYESTDDAGYSSSEAPVNAGSYKVTISINNADPKYIGTVSTAFSITKKTITVKVKDKTIFVGDSIPSLTELKKDTDYTIEGLVSDDDLAGTLGFSYTDESGKETVPNNTSAGTYFIAASGLENPNYEFVYTAGKLVIESKQSSGDNSGSNSGGSVNLGTGGSGNSTIPSTDSNTTSPDNTKPSTDSNDAPPTTNTDKTETRPDGTVIKTEEKTTENGTKIKTVTETAPDGTVTKEYVTETATDGSAIATTKTTNTNRLGTTISKVMIETITANGKITQTTEKSSFHFDNAETVVTTVKDSSGSVTEASAHISKQGEITATGKTKLTISNALTDQITEAAGTEDINIVVSVTDNINRTLYSLTVNKKKLESGNSLYLYEYDAKTGAYTMVNAVEYKTADNQDITIKANAGRNYTLLNKTEMNRVSKQIMKTVKLSTSQKTKKSGKSFKVSLSKKANKASIKKIVYTTSNKKIATVTKKGQVKTKTAGIVRVKAKVTMKNGKAKTLVMKVKVKK